MLLGKIKEISYKIGETTILDAVSAEIPQDACVAIVGANGAGKSTLLSILAGELAPTSGSLHWVGPRPSLTYFKQEQREEGDQENTGEMYVYRSKWHLPDHVRYATASGGERMKIRLSAALSRNSQLVLLDEPTNHMDAESLEELVRVINQKQATYLIVSHDRHFIDQTADYVLELEDGKMTVYTGNYTSYREKKEQAHAIQVHHYEKQQREIKQVQEQIAQLKEWSAKAHAESTKKGGAKEYYRVKAKKKDVQIRSMQKRLGAKLAKERVEKPAEETTVWFDVKGERKKGHRVMELQNVQKSYGNQQLFSNVSFTVQAGERLALIGPNGSGKSTLFSILTGNAVCEGEVWLSNGLSIGYMSQAVLDLPQDITMAEHFHRNSFAEQGKLRTQLANLGLTEIHWGLKLGELSQGERVKVKLMQFILQGTDVLLLDEPTNHLDLPSREQLEKTLEAFPGTLLIASHDRYFIEKLAKGLLLFEKGTVQKRPVTFQEWVDRKDAPEERKTPEDRLRLETELQAVLGQLSMEMPGSDRYKELDAAFHEVSRKLRELNR
ncbi:ABC transporter ATP-binding protein [Sporosarcina sp. NCCP-2222]|uniref:ribosomal protection-like ABC-F family protein n=1 Tax=Sporosarcina sp. NCCP-2222 TaxID=2935073 RepID=UPI0020829BA0|nr:ABC-F family ATP-binding cassette domain-containing protein [Sporosarcina sp. NCCP-2222]GKV55177.1 ABC transporter ATP-binding protein [Sporosarcina sp. NCCP-2222]